MSVKYNLGSAPEIVIYPVNTGFNASAFNANAAMTAFEFGYSVALASKFETILSNLWYVLAASVVVKYVELSYEIVVPDAFINPVPFN